MGRFWGTKAVTCQSDRPSPATSNAFDVPIPPESLTWQLSTEGLTTQYKSFYFTFDNGSAGYIQYAYGNLGALVKVAPIGFTYYTPGRDPIVASYTLRASQIKVSKDETSVNIGPHSLIMNDQHTGWEAVITDPKLSFTLSFSIKSDAFMVQDFGRNAPIGQLRHKIIPHLIVEGTVQAHGESMHVSGHGTYIEAFFMHVKFTDCCSQFVNFQLRTHDSGDVLTLLQYIPRNSYQDRSFISQGSYTRNGEVISINFKNSAVFEGNEKHSASGYGIPERCRLEWSGETMSGHEFKASCLLQYQRPSSITDVLSIFPKFLKDIVSIWAGLPYVFCYRVPETIATISIDGVVSELRGTSSTELTMVHKI